MARIEGDADQFTSHPVLSPTDWVLEKLRKLSVPLECLERNGAGLLQYVKDKRSKMPEIIAALLPGVEELQTVFENSSSTDEVRWTLPREFKKRCREGVRWAQWLMFEADPDLVLEAIRRQTGGQKGVCGAVWGSDDIAYRCRTCENDPTCAICVPCFQAGSHANHDYSMIHTGGGCCDCGDITAWKPSGFCSMHRGPGQVSPLPEAFVSSAQQVLEILLLEWARCLRAAEKVSGKKSKNWEYQMAEEKVASITSSAMVEMLLAFCNCSESMLTFTAGLVGSNDVCLLDTLLRTEYFLPKEVVGTLHELLFKLMGDLNFKYQFAVAFIGNYPHLILDAIHEELESSAGIHGSSKENPTLSSFSVQIFTVPTLTPRLVIELKLLDMLLETMKELFLNCAGDDGRIMVRKSANSFYYRVLEDIRFVMSHAEVAQYVVQERPDLSRAWLHLLAYIQGMEPQKRVTSIHIEEETDGWISAYCLELQMASIHPLFVSGAATADQLSQQTEAFAEEELNGDAFIGRHAKIGRTSKYNGEAGILGMGSRTVEMEEKANRGGHFPDGDARSMQIGAYSKSVLGSDNSFILNIPTALRWFISECTKVLDTWVALDACQEQAKSKLSIVEGVEAAAQRRRIRWRGRWGRGVTSDSHGPDSSNLVLAAEENSGRQNVIRERVQYSCQTAISDPSSRHNIGEPTGRIPVNAEEASEMDTDVPLVELGEEMENGGVGTNGSADWWIGTRARSPVIGLGHLHNGKDWMAIDFDVSRQETSFHIPLHRMLALLIHKCMDMGSADFDKESDGGERTGRSHKWALGQAFFTQIFPIDYWPTSFSSILMEHPLRLQVFCAQVRAGMWRRNGFSVLSLCDYYHSVRWCDDSLDLDLFLLQCCGVMLPPEEFMERIQSRFGLADYFSLFLLRPNEYEPALAQEMLALVIRIVSERGLCGFSAVKALRRELIRRLAIRDSTHSELIRSLPPRLSDDKHLQEILDDVAIYCNPSGMQQGKYSIRKECWKELDLYHPRWIPMELQSAEDRYMRACEASAMIQQLPQWQRPYAPLLSINVIATSARVLDILRSVFFHAAFSENISESRAPEGVLFTALHLLALGLDICSLILDKQDKTGSQTQGLNDLVFELSDPSLTFDEQEMPPLLVQATKRVHVGGADGTETSGWQSLLSLLVILMQKYSNNRFHGTGESNSCNIGILIKNLLAKFAELHRGCMYEIESLAPEILHRVSASLNGKSFETKRKGQQKRLLEEEKRKALARERQAAIMAEMKAAQEKFVASLQPSDGGSDSKARSKKKELVGKIIKESTPERDSFHRESMAVVCALCRDAGSRTPTSYLTLVQRSRLIAIAENGKLSWEKGMRPGSEAATPLQREGADDSQIGDELQNSVDSWNQIQMFLAGDMGRGTPMEVDTFLELSTDPMNRIENDKTRESAMVAVLLEYVTLLSRNLKEQQQHGDNDAAGPPSRRTNTLRSSIPSSMEAVLHDIIGSNDSIGVHMSSCGHAVHQECLDRYLSSLLQRYYSRTLFEGLQIVDPDKGEFLCPVCRRLANSVMPATCSISRSETDIGQSVEVGHALPSRALSMPHGSSSSGVGLSVLMKEFKLQQALTLLHNAEDFVSKMEFRKTVSKPLPKCTKTVLDSLFLRLCGLYFSEDTANKRIPVHVNQSLLLWDVLRYSLMSTELAARLWKPKARSIKSENWLDVQWRAGSCTKVLPLLLQAARGTVSQNQQTLLLRARGMQLLVWSICSGVSKDSLSETFMPGRISKYVELIYKGQYAMDLQFWRRTAGPVLAYDPTSSLVWLVFCLPPLFLSSTEPFISLVHLLYLVCVIQAVAFTGRSLASDLQISLAAQAFVQNLISTLKGTPICKLLECNTVRIPQGSPLEVIRRLTLPYLRRCALFQRLLFNASPDIPHEEETSGNLREDTAVTSRDAFNIIDSEEKEAITDAQAELREVEELEQNFCLPPLQSLLEDENTQDAALKWCRHFLWETKSRKFEYIAHPVTAAPFQLMQLPMLYQDLLQHYIKERCPVCSTVPEQPALCLLCGRLCCGAGRHPCCSLNRQSECYTHAVVCGAGVGVYLMIRKTNILLQRCARNAYWPSPYLDAFGEEDIDMTRGKPLYLSEERYAALTAMVASHGLDHSSLVLYRTTRET